MKSCQTKPSPEIKAVDLFCGVGGLTHGLVREGIDVMAGIDIDPACRYPYEENNSASFLEQDVKDVTANSLKELLGNSSVTLLGKRQYFRGFL